MTCGAAAVVGRAVPGHSVSRRGERESEDLLERRTGHRAADPLDLVGSSAGPVGALEPEVEAIFDGPSMPHEDSTRLWLPRTVGPRTSPTTRSCASFAGAERRQPVRKL